jgi:hypothetical protein
LAEAGVQARDGADAKFQDIAIDGYGACLD